MNSSINGDRAALGIFFKGLMVFEQMLDSPDKGGYMLMAEEGIIEVGSFKAADHAAAVIGIVEEPCHPPVGAPLSCGVSGSRMASRLTQFGVNFEAA